MTLRLQPVAAYAGASPYATDPVIVVRLDLAEVDAETWRALETGMRVLREIFPDWLAAASSPHPTLAQSLGQTIADWALAALNEVRGFLHAAGAAATDGGVRLWLGYHHPGVSLAALELALELIQQAGRAGKIERAAVAERLESLWRRCRRYHPDSESHILMQAARIGWPCVVKPLAMGGGKGITAGIGNFAALELAFAQAREYATRAGEVMVERHVQATTIGCW